MNRVPFVTLRRILYLVFGINFLGYLLYFMYFSSTITLTPPQQRKQLLDNYAYITFANNDEYAKGAVALAMSLLEVRSYYPLVVMITKEVSATTISLLENIGCIIYQTELIKLPPELSLQTARWGPAFTKLVAWEKTEFTKLIFLDSDLLILKNVDDLFDTQHNLLATLDADASSCRYFYLFFIHLFEFWFIVIS